MEKVTRIRFMFQTRSLSTGFLVASLGIAAGLSLFTSQNVSAAGTPCTGTIGDAELKKAPDLAKVQTACKSGGKEAVKAAMKKAMTAANDKDKAGLKCDSCHKDGGPKYETKGNAVDDFEKMGKYL
jgi:hypothetical protein